MQRLEKVNMKSANDINNGNRNGREFTETVFRSLSKSFCINSINIVDGNDAVCGDLKNSLDDDVFFKDEKLSTSGEPLTASPGSSCQTPDDSFTFGKVEGRSSLSEDSSRQGDQEKSSEDAKKLPGRVGLTRRSSDVIDSMGDVCLNRRQSWETNGIPIATPGSPALSDLGYSGSFTSTSFSYPPQVYSFGGKGINDMPDSIPFTIVNEGSVTKDLEATMPVDRDAEEYNMYHPRRGRAIIINNDIFDFNLASPRTGSLVDVKNLEQVFVNLGFEVTVIYNPTFHQIRVSIYELSQEDHSDADCLVVCVLTHGMENGWLFARDSMYPIEALWQSFTADKCLTLAGKPKIFFIQACRGSKVDPGVTLMNRKGSVSETDAATAAYKIPSHSDFLIAHSSVDGFYSWRNTEEGTWFIQSLVQELSKSGSTVNFLKILTRVNRKVALDFSSYNCTLGLHDQKQVSSFQSTLIRDLIFRPKIPV